VLENDRNVAGSLQPLLSSCNYAINIAEPRSQGCE